MIMRNKIDFKLYNKLFDTHYCSDEVIDDGFVIVDIEKII